MKGLRSAGVAVVLSALLAPLPSRAQTPTVTPDVQDLLKKAQQLQNLTPAERQRLREWAKGLKDAKYSGEILSPVRSSVCQPEPDGPAPTTPSKDEYLALLHQLQDRYGTRAGVEGRTALDAVPAEGPPGAGGAVGVLLVMGGFGSGGIYALAGAAAQHPDDYMTASNLGAALDAMGDRDDAARVLLYALTLKPDSLLAATNLGWAYFNSGRLKSAEPLFVGVRKADPTVDSARYGVGLTAECRGDHAAALAALGAASASGAPPPTVVAQMADAASQAQADQGQPETPPPAPPGASPGLQLPRPALPSTGVEAANAAAGLMQAALQVRSRMESLTKQLPQSLQAYQAALSQPLVQRSGMSVTFLRDYSPEEEEIGSLGRRYGRRLVDADKTLHAVIVQGIDQFTARNRRSTEQLVAELGDCGSDRRCQVQAKNEHCKRMQDAANQAHNLVYPAFATHWSTSEPLIRGYYAQTTPLLTRIQNDARNAHMNLKREIMVLGWYQPSVVEASAWAHVLFPATCQKEALPPPPGEEAAVSHQRGDCKEKTPIGFKLKIPEVATVGISVNCEKAVFDCTWDMGKVLKPTFSLTGDLHNGNLTLFAGVKVGDKLLPGLAPLGGDVGAKGGIFITENNGQFVDAGLQASVGGNISGLGAELKGKLSIMDGPSGGVENSFKPQVGGE